MYVRCRLCQLILDKLVIQRCDYFKYNGINFISGVDDDVGNKSC